MRNGEAATSTKPYKASSPAQEQHMVHPYPDWATMQAYYGPGVPMPPPYLAAAVASGHPPPPYMWGAQPFMPPYGAPFSAYTHGVYPHSSITVGPHAHRQGIIPSPSPSTNDAVVMATPLSREPLVKSLENKGRGLLKKLKGLDGLPVSNGDGNVGSASGSVAHGKSQSEESSEEGSSNGSDGSDENSEPGDNKTWRMGYPEAYPRSGKDKKEAGLENVMALTNITGELVVTVAAAKMENKVSANGELTATTAPLPRANRVPIDLQKQEDRTLKREKRKQSNRESARRSRLRKQAETEELAMRVDTLGAENTILRTEITQLREDAEKLRLENMALMEELSAVSSDAEETLPEKVSPEGPATDNTENFLSKLNSSVTAGSESSDSDGGKLHQLLGTNSITDAVAAS